MHCNALNDDSLHWRLIAACDHCQISHQCSDRQIGQWSSKIGSGLQYLALWWVVDKLPCNQCQCARVPECNQCQSARMQTDYDKLWVSLQCSAGTHLFITATFISACKNALCSHYCTAIIQNSRFNIVAMFAKQMGVSGVTMLVELVYHSNRGGGACEIQTQ